MQTSRSIKNGIRYVKTVNEFSTTHTFARKTSPFSRRCVKWGDNYVLTVVLASASAYEKFRAKGLFWSAGDGAAVRWLP